MKIKNRFDYLCIMLLATFIIVSFVAGCTTGVDTRTVLLLEKRIENMEKLDKPINPVPSFRTAYDNMLTNAICASTVYTNNRAPVDVINASIVKALKEKVDNRIISDRSFRLMVKELINN